MSLIPGESQRLRTLWWCAVFLLAAALWSVHIGRPVDLPNWHEFDYSSIARNFVREGSNFYLPRIDWRGDGPGFTEMEMPLIPWIMAKLYLVFGVHELIGRVLSLLFSLCALFVFSCIARKFLPGPAALIATLFVVVSHEMLIVATAILPEALMLLCYLLAIYFFIDWYDRKTWFSFALAAGSFSTAMLVKSPATHLAIFFFIWVVMKDGWRVFRMPGLYLFAALSFVPALVWYVHAASLWHQFHNSMGVSNEDHWIGLDMLRRPKVLANLISIDLVYVFGFGGFLVVLASVIRSRLSTAVNRLALSWGLSVAIYLLVIMRTAGANWAAYYHVVAVPPVALLFGSGVYLVGAHQRLSWFRMLLWISLPAVLLALALWAIERKDTSHLPGVFHDLAAAQTHGFVLAVLIVLCYVVTVLCFSRYKSETNIADLQPAWLAPLVVIGCFTYFVTAGQLLLSTRTLFDQPSTQFQAAACLRSHLLSPGLIVASGGICQDSSGHRLANDAPYMFYWLDRKGFTTCEGHQSISELVSYRKRGARYFVAEQAALSEQPGFRSELMAAFPLLADCKSALLFSLDANPK